MQHRVRPALLPLLPLLPLLLALGACAAAVPDDEETESEEQAIRNATISGTKLCVRVTADATLFRDPEGGATVTTTSARGAGVPTGRYVLVQTRPGRVGSRVWADPDLSGLRSEGERAALAKRCRISVEAATRAVAEVGRDHYTRRGWIEVSALTGGLAKSLGPEAANGPAFDASDRDRSGDLRPGTLRKVKDRCFPQGEYVGSDPRDPAGFYTYGTCVDWQGEGGRVVCRAWGRELYLSYGTPEVEGGGISLGYLGVGATVHELGAHVHAQRGAHCQTDVPGGPVRCNGDAPSAERDRRIAWSEIYARGGGRTVKGWVPSDCLE
jgi:hypothetical protein